MESRTHSPGGSSCSKGPVKPPIEIVVDNFDDNEIVQQRCVILTGKCASNPLRHQKIWVTCLGVYHEVIQKHDTRELSDTGEFNIPLLLSYGRNDITLTVFNTSTSLVFCLIYLPPPGTPVIQLVALIASDSPHRPVIKKKKSKAEDKSKPPLWSFAASSNRLRTTAYMCQAFMAEEMKRHKWGPRTFHMKENWLERDMKYIQPEVRRIYTDKTVAEIQAAELDHNNGVQSHQDGWVQILNAELLKIDEYDIPGTVVLGIVMDAKGPSEDNMFRDMSSTFKLTPNGLSLAVCGGSQTRRLPTVLPEFETLPHDENEPFGSFIQEDGTSTRISDLEAASISQLSILNALLLALGMPNTFNPISPHSALSWASRFRAPNLKTTPLHWHTMDIETLLPSRFIPLPSHTKWTPSQPTYRIIYGRGSHHPHHAIKNDFPVLLIESTSRITKIHIQGKHFTFPASKSPDWVPNHLLTLSYMVCRQNFNFHAALSLRIEAVDGSILEIEDVWKIEGGWKEDAWERRAREAREEVMLIELMERENA